MSKSYQDLEIYKLSMELFIKAHKFSLQLPKYELYELGSQLRRAADSVNSNIVEGYGRKRYKNDFIKFLTYSQASNYEVVSHLSKLRLLYPEFESEIGELHKSYMNLGGKIHNFTEYVFKNWN